MADRAIRTKYLRPTVHRPARIKVTSGARGPSAVLAYDCELSDEANALAAMRLLASQMRWVGVWAMGRLGDDAYVCVRVTDTGHDTFEVR